MPQTVYLLCAFTSLACAILLARAYHSTRVPLLLWSVVCFTALTIANILLFIDLIVFPSIDLRPFRNGVTLVGVTSLLYGLVGRDKQ